MQQQNRHSRPNRKIESGFINLVKQISRQKLLPKIMWNAAKELGSKRLINYQKQVRRQYENQLRSPLKYNGQQAKSSRQKFRDKITKLLNNQLQIDYFQNVKLNNKTLVTYQGTQIEKSRVQTKKQYQMFSNFNEKKFNQTYSNIFQDKLEVDYNNIYSKKNKERSNTLNMIQDKASSQLQEAIQQSNASRIKNIRMKTQLSTKEKKRDVTIQLLSARKKPIIYFNEKKMVGSRLNIDQEQQTIRIMREIGGYSQKIPIKDITLTKQSINKWLKSHYEKPNRIFDFLQIKEVQSMGQFWEISRKLRVMPIDHLLFMTFLYFDANNDGYICDYDLQKLSNLSLKRPVLVHDYQKLKQSNIKKKLSRIEAYFELYKLGQVTESIYFEWKKKRNDDIGQDYGMQIQLKNRILSSKQRHIFLDFKAFENIYKNDKPFLWYDLLHLFCGISYQGLKY